MESTRTDRTGMIHDAEKKHRAWGVIARRKRTRRVEIGRVLVPEKCDFPGWRGTAWHGKPTQPGGDLYVCLCKVSGGLDVRGEACGPPYPTKGVSEGTGRKSDLGCLAATHAARVQTN